MVVRACLCLLAGAYALQLSSFARDSDRVAVTLFAVSVIVVLRRPFAAAALLSGLVLFYWAAMAVIDTRLDARLAGDSLLTELTIVDFPRLRGRSLVFVAEPLDAPFTDARIPPRVRLSWFDPDAMPRIGETWQFEIRLRRPRGNANPGGFDYETWLFRERIGATGYVVGGKRNLRLRPSEDRLARLRERLVERIQRVAGSTPEAAVLAAISVGARHQVSQRQWERYARSGLSHLMAISGLHIGLAAATAFMLLRLLLGLLRVPGNTRHLALAGSLLIAAAYAMLAGFAVPAQRAAVMLLLAAIVVIARRRVRPLTVLAVAAAMVTLVDPLATMTPGFRFSFAAVLLLLWFAVRLQPGDRRSLMARPVFGVRVLGEMQLVLLFGLLPLSVAIFDRVALHAPLVNLLAVPLFSFVTVPATLMGLVLGGPLEFAGDWLLRVAASSVAGLEAVIDRTVRLPGSDTRIASLDGNVWLLLVPVLCWVVVPPGWPGRWLAWLVLACLIGWRPPAPPAGCMDTTFLDVGQGQAIVVRTRDHVAVYDTGPAYRGGTSQAERVVLPYLVHRGITRVDRLIVSHGDIDHAGGVDAILDGIDVSAIVTGEALPVDSHPVSRCRAGDAWYWGGIRFEFLHPPRHGRLSGNDASCVLLVSAGERRLLLTGDIEVSAEGMLVEQGSLVTVDVVSVPHHGSRTSSTPAFVEGVAASHAIVSAGYANRWGMPDERVAGRWRAAGATLLNTAVSGAITVRLCADTDELPVSEFRRRRSGLWHPPVE